MISVLIPTYNLVCVRLVEELLRQMSRLNIDGEIIVADDGSSNLSTIADNSKIEQYDNCRFIVNPKNIGTARNRNLLMREAKYPHLLFLDSDTFPTSDDFLKNYLDAADKADVVVGGLRYSPDAIKYVNPLRLKYGYQREIRTAEQRALRPYDSFLSSNFMVNRKVAETIRFDESFDRYGHEDTLFGVSLRLAGMSILHIEAPVYHNDTDTSEQYLEKTRIAIQSLTMHYEELRGHSHLITWFERLSFLKLTGLVGLVYKYFRSPIEANLQGKNPILFLLDVYKLSYMCRVFSL